jgi:hypothetical protein
MVCRFPSHNFPEFNPMNAISDWITPTRGTIRPPPRLYILRPTAPNPDCTV